MTTIIDPPLTPPLTPDDYFKDGYVQIPRGFGFQVVYSPESDSVLLYGYGHGYSGFVTSVQTPETLWMVIREEAATPGALGAAMKDYQSPRTPLQRETERELIRQFISRKIVGTGQTKPGRPPIVLPSIDDLDV